MNVDFYRNNDDRFKFLFFLALQYVRTDRMKSSILGGSLGENIKMQIERVWNVLSVLMPRNIAHSSMNNQLLFLQNHTEIPFLTGDQPVVNSQVPNASDDPPQNLELYYPISPKLAVLITEDVTYSTGEVISLGVEKVRFYNTLIVDNAKDQVFAASKTELSEIARII